MAASVIIALIGIFIAYRIYVAKPLMINPSPDKLGKVHTILFHKYYVDEFYGATVVRPFIKLSELIYNLIDRVLVDGTINIVAYMTLWTGEILKWFQTGNVRNYIVTFMLGVVLFVGYVLLKWI